MVVVLVVQCRSGGKWPSSYCGVTDSIPGASVWDLWCAKWHYRRICCLYL